MSSESPEGPHERMIGRLLEHAECHAHVAPQDDDQREWAADLRSAAAELEHYAQATAAQAAELDRLRADRDALALLLGECADELETELHVTGRAAAKSLAMARRARAKLREIGLPHGLSPNDRS